MKKAMLLLGMCLLVSGCVSSGPVISKSSIGNLEINVQTSDGKRVAGAELYLDGVFVGNLTARLPVIHAKRGERTIVVKSSGFVPYEKKITILGDPNHQVLNVVLEKQ